MAFNSASAINPKSHEVWNYRGFVLEDLGRLNEAIESFDKSFDANPRFFGSIK